jgi:hypothetical protein
MISCFRPPTPWDRSSRRCRPATSTSTSNATSPSVPRHLGRSAVWGVVVAVLAGEGVWVGGHRGQTWALSPEEAFSTPPSAATANLVVTPNESPRASIAPREPIAPIEFQRHILPLLTRAGCNAGACHGAATGRGGMALSLWGSDPDADYFALVEQWEGRRTNLARPAQSLIVLKPTGMLDHGGDVALDDRGAAQLTAWITAGAPRGPTRRVVRLEVEAEPAWVDTADTPVQLRAVARYADGTREEVTHRALWRAADPGSATLDIDQAQVRLLRPGRHVVTARFLDQVAPCLVTRPIGDMSFDHAAQPRANYVDDFVYQSLTELRLPCAGPADDESFVRRATLDLIGRLPAPTEVDAFCRDERAEKRGQLVERLLASDAFADYWAYRLATLLRSRGLPNDRQAPRVFHAWLRDQLRGEARWDQMVHEMLTAVGDSHEIGPANFARMASDPRAHAELVSYALLGVRMQCANCHNHPLDHWTQDDYHGLAAVFARVSRHRHVGILTRGGVTHPRTGGDATPRIPGVGPLPPDEDPRRALAAWLTAQDNPLLATAIVNRLWQALFGRGLVEPVDDLRATNPASHPELLEALTSELIASGYDLRQNLRRMALSHAYGRAALPATSDHRALAWYGGASVRPLPAEVLADAIAEVVSVADHYEGYPAETRAIELVDPTVPAASLDILGRCSRTASCDDPTLGGGLAAQLHLLNGAPINAKLAAAHGRLQKLLTTGATTPQIVVEFYRRAYGRLPRPTEASFWSAQIPADDLHREPALVDFVWSLLASQEFTTNH